MKRKATKYYMLLLLVILFIAPGVAAYVFYQHPAWLGNNKINKGTLLAPPCLFPLLEGKSKWHIVFWNPGSCDALCLQELDTLARIRLALGRKLYQVDQWLILGDKATPLSQETQTFLKKLDFQVAKWLEMNPIGQEEVFSEKKVFLANPDNYLILSYSSRANPEDLYQDLKLLLKTNSKQE